MNLSRPWLPVAIFAIVACDFAFAVMGFAYGGSLVGNVISIKTIAIGGGHYATESLVASLLAAALPLVVTAAFFEARYRWSDRDWLRCAMVTGIAVTGTFCFIHLAHGWISKALVGRAGEPTLWLLTVDWHLTALLTLSCIGGSLAFASNARSLGDNRRDDAEQTTLVKEPHPTYQPTSRHYRAGQLIKPMDPSRLSPQARPGCSASPPHAPKHRGLISDGQPVHNSPNTEFTRKSSCSRIRQNRPTMNSAPTQSSGALPITRQFLAGGTGARGPPPNGERVPVGSKQMKYPPVSVDSAAVDEVWPNAAEV